MRVYTIIPARYASSRLPGKMLADIAGKPLIQHTYESASQADGIDAIIATDDERIMNAANTFGATAVMTDPNHQSGTERLVEVVTTQSFEDDDIVVNLQGDEPFLPARLIEQVATNLKAQSDAVMATLCEPLTHIDDVMDPNKVKVIKDEKGMAIYFSRAPIPWARDAFAQTPKVLPSGQVYFRHIGIYAYRVGFLKQYTQLPISQLEVIERLEQLRVLAHGKKIHVDVAVADAGIGIDTPEDLARAIQLAEGR